MSERMILRPHAAAVPEEQSAAAGHARVFLTLLMATPLLITFWLYWPTLSQPYFWDDVVHFMYVLPRSVRELWASAEGLGAYYRPIPLTLYKLLITLQPPGSTTASHVLALLVHAANAVLTGCLARRLLSMHGGGKWACPVLGAPAPDAAALVAALLFACYPFAALPVAHVAAAIMHPPVTLLMLGAVLATLRYTRTGHAGWLLLSIGLGVLAPYTHESGIMAGALALLVAALDDWRAVWARRKWLWALPVASAAFLPVWLLVPKMPTAPGWPGGADLLANVTFFTQGPTFPFQPLSRLLINWLPQLNPSPLLTFAGLPWWVVAAMWGVALAALAVAAVSLHTERRWRIFGVALAWALLVALPSILVLPVPYVTVSQRLLYSAAPGAVMLWAAACVALVARMRRPVVQAIAALMLVAGIAVVPVLYVQREMRLHELALQPLEQLAAVARSYPEERHLVVNAVNWVNYREPWYALGQEGVSVSAPYIELDTLVWVNARTSARFEAATFTPIWPELDVHSFSTIDEDNPWDWADVAILSPQYDRVWIADYTEEAIRVAEAGSVHQGVALSPEEILAQFGDGVFLTRGAVSAGGSTVTVALDWKVLEGVPEATIFRHVYDCDGNLLAQGDGFALGRMLRLELLEPGSEVHDVRQIPVREVPADGCMLAGVGLYLPDGTRVPARQADGSAIENDAVLLRPVREPHE